MIAPRGTPVPLSVVILTLNAEKHLPACLLSAADCDDLVVIDSGSTDRTVALARSAGARVLVNPFTDFAAQRNFAHDRVEFRHPWVFHLDADETFSPALVAECAALDPHAPYDGYFAAPHMMFHGRWLRRCTDFPVWQARCVRARGFRFVQTGHGQREAPGMRMGYLRHHYSHDVSVDDQRDWDAKHRRYARQEARQILQSRDSVAALLRVALFSPPLARRRALKQLSYLLPARPLLRFLYQYVLRGGFLDGRYAIRYCRLLARYEGFAAAELQQLRASHGN